MFLATLGFFLSLDPTSAVGLSWNSFTVSHAAEVSTDFSNLAVERFYVRLPCKISVWFKLFLRREDGLNSHIELFNQVKGNIFCNGAGAKKYYGGEKTDFTMEDGAMECEIDQKSIILVVEKTAYRVTIKNWGKVLYEQAFTDKDANCQAATTVVKTQLWKYEGALDLAVLDNSAPHDCWLADTGAYAASSVISSKSSQNINDCKDWCNADAICQAFVFFSQKCVKLATETLTYKSGRQGGLKDCWQSYEVSGITSAIKDDIVAIAECNAGDKAVKCSSNFAMATNLDGVRIYDNHCEVSMSDRSASHVSVTATCRPNRSCSNNVALEKYQYIATTQDHVTGFSKLDCPDGYDLIGCYITSTSAQDFDYTKLDTLFGGIVQSADASGVCSFSPITDIRYSLTAACQISTSVWDSNDCEDFQRC